MMTDCKDFTIRVYGVVIRDDQRVLLTDELRYGVKMTKFPGGGLHYGEGLVDCLKREFLEELQQEPIHIRHFYTTDFFQPTALVSPPRQLISIYYLADLPHPEKVVVTDRPFDFEELEGAQTFRWVPVEILKPDHLTYPIDQLVVRDLIKSLVL